MRQLFGANNKTKVWIEDKPYENKLCVEAGRTCNES
jgi:hypothetical protein